MASPLKKPDRYGWYVYILQGATGTLHVGLTKNVEEDVRIINSGDKNKKFVYCEHDLPVKAVFIDHVVQFVEAYAKFSYLKKMTKRLRKKLIEEKIWPLGGDYIKYVEKKMIDEADDYK